MNTSGENLIQKDIEQEMKDAYLDYSMSVIASRALPDVRDGLKPVHRRILYTMYGNGLYPEREFRKCADTVGNVLGQYHPHGDASVYDALVRLAQDFSLRYPLVHGHGNFGSIDGDPPAAYRYTESKMSKISMQMLTDIDKETVDFQSNYDDRLKEPTVLPSRFPNLLVNGSTGIAVGMALFVNYMGFGDSILAGSLTLGLLCVPLVIRTTEEALKAIPDSMREGSRALGATKLQTIWHVILPMGMPNIITGLILALGRVSGETAPILFTCAAYFLPQLPTGIFDQCMALPYHLYVISTSGTDMEAQLPLAYGTALVLIMIILFVNLLANALRKYFEKRVKTN